MFKKIFLIISLILLASCSENKSENSLTVGTSADNPPFELLDKGQVIGFDIDLIQMIAKELEQEIEIKNIEFNGLIPSLNSKHVDLVIAGLTHTSEREKSMDFSIPYATSSIAVITRKDSSITNVRELQNKKIGVQLGTTWEIAAKEIANKYGAQDILSLANNLVLIEELKNNRIDAVILEQFQVEKFIQQNPNLEGFDIGGYISEFSIALPKGSPLKPKLDKIIAQLQNNGKIDELKEKWFK